MATVAARLAAAIAAIRGHHSTCATTTADRDALSEQVVALEGETTILETQLEDALSQMEALALELGQGTGPAPEASGG